MKLCYMAACVGSVLFPIAGHGEEISVHEADVCVYGGTASGVMAAIAAAREGLDVIIVEPSRWLGGMTGGGIDHLDWGRDEAVGGTTLRFLSDAGGEVSSQKPDSGSSTYVETTRIGSSNAEYRRKFRQEVARRGIKVIYDHRLGGVVSENGNIRSLTLDHAPADKTGCPIPKPLRFGAMVVKAKVFIDCGYEGDLMAMSGVSYTWGRESREKYGESLAGVRPSLWVYDIDPYIEPGNPESGLVPFVQNGEIGPLGAADRRTMGYCFRFKFDRGGKGIPIPAPERYDPAEFTMFRRALENKVDIFTARHRTAPDTVEEVKGAPDFSTNLSRALWSNTIYGSNEEYPDGDWAVRSRIWKFQQQFQCKLVHFARTDPSVPEGLKRRAEQLTFEAGEFDETGGWPHQLYVREARRMVADYVVTESDLAGKTNPPHPVGLGSYGVDDWPYATVVENGSVALQGGGFSIFYFADNPHEGIYKIPYESIVPRIGECANLIVPVCLSASHIAMTSIRMEPVWMILGESAGVAAAIAVQTGESVQEVPYGQLRLKLNELGQKLERPGGVKKPD